MSAIHASVSCGLSQVSVTARMSIVLEIIRSVREAVFSRIERMLVVANTISIQYYQWKYTILHSMYSVGATQLWLRVRVPFVDSLLNIQRNSRSITKDHSTDPQSQWPLPGIYLWNYAIFFRINS